MLNCYVIEERKEGEIVKSSQQYIEAGVTSWHNKGGGEPREILLFVMM